MSLYCSSNVIFALQKTFHLSICLVKVLARSCPKRRLSSSTLPNSHLNLSMRFLMTCLDLLLLPPTNLNLKICSLMSSTLKTKASARTPLETADPFSNPQELDCFLLNPRTGQNMSSALSNLGENDSIGNLL